MSFWRSKEVDPQIVIYHDPCCDGFTAAWVLYHKFGSKVEYLPAKYEEGRDNHAYWIEKCAGKRVVVVDFAFQRPLTEKLHEACKSFEVIDHHISNKKTLGDLPYCQIEIGKCGSLLAWEKYFPDEEVPDLVKYVNDQDLWLWQQPQSKEICTYINAQKRTFINWYKLAAKLSSPDQRKFYGVAAAGEAMLEKEAAICRAVARDWEIWNIRGHEVPGVNCPHELRSIVCDLLGREEKGFPFVAGYSIRGGTVAWSIRSTYGSLDVSVLAKTFPGGGGHAQAAGFSVPVEEVDFSARRLG